MVRLALTWCLLAVAGCGHDGGAPSFDAAATGVRVTGCDDPGLWSAAALESGYILPQIGGGACSPAQYPLHQAFLSWYADRGLSSEERDHLDRTCWRVADASPGSGWIAGQQFAADRDGAPMMIAGFARPVTVEGRVLRDDGTVAFALDPAAVTLDAMQVLDDDAAATTAVISPEAWVEHDAVELWGQRVATDEVLDATTFPLFNTAPFTIHRTSAGLVRRSWWRDAGQLQHADLALGAGTRARIAKFGAAVVIDDELVLIDEPATVRRIPLGSEPSEVVGNYYRVTLHLDGAVVQYDHGSGTARSLPVGDGVLLPAARDDAPVFFDGTRFRPLAASDPLGFDDAATFTPRPDDLAALGTPVAVMHGIVLGEHGLLAALDAASPVPGPRFASYADLFGDGTIGPVAADSAAYVIAHGDGSAALYRAPFVDYCE